MKLKRILLIIMFCFILTGCSKSWEKYILIENLEINDGVITGEFVNKKDKAYDIKYVVSYKNDKDKGNLECYDLIKPNETKKLKCNTLLDGEYEIKIIDVSLIVFEIPNLMYGELYQKSLQYHFTDIYQNHLTLLEEFVDNDLGDLINYPYINKIVYTEEEKVEISYEYIFEESSISFYERYNAFNNELEEFVIKVNNYDNEIYNSVKNTLVDSFIFKGVNKSALLNILNDVNNEMCVEIDSWCVSILDENDIINSLTFKIVKQ